MDEFQRLKNLIPRDLNCLISISSNTKKSTNLIHTSKINDGKFEIVINSKQWTKLEPNQRDLMFWHEIYKIKSNKISNYRWEKIVIAIGVSSSLMEILSHNVFSLSVILLVTALVTYRLYQGQTGEQAILIDTTADQGAVRLATDFGYSFWDACNSLRDALKFLAKNTSNKSISTRYIVRLQVLKVFAFKQEQRELSLV